MTDRTAVCNQALALLGQGLIASFEDETQKAGQCRAFYDSSVDAVFECFPWPFAIKRKALAKDADYPGVWSAYKLPTDYRYFVRNAVDRESDYLIEGRNLVTTARSVTLVYVSRVSEGLWPGQFTEVVAARLAANLAYPVTESNTKAANMYAAYKDRLRDAKTTLGIHREVEDYDPSDLAYAHRAGV
ncbi:MAG: hypothetical protein GVY18_15680 [Bacteroidetes bacterium]|nr:hypothetical protein [Bacteroidota bacterium]